MNNSQNKSVIYGVGGIIIGLIIAGVFYPAMSNSGFGMMNWGNDSAYDQRGIGASRTASAIDKHFIEQMIPHHDGAIAMAKLALEKAKRPEIKTLAQSIISAQESENLEMKSWYKDWFGSDVLKVGVGMMSGGMMSQSGMHMGGQEDISELANATDFDKAFIEQMIPHHQLAIMMANMLQSGTNNPQMQRLAKNIISSQSSEIQQMQVWYTEWYK